MDIVSIAPGITCIDLVKQLDRHRYDWPLILVMPDAKAKVNHKWLGSKAFICISGYDDIALVLRNPNASYRNVFYPWRIDFEEIRAYLLKSRFEERAFGKLFKLVKGKVDSYGSTHDGLVSAFRFVGIEDIYQHLMVV